jgi:hypothetical protein
MKTRTAVYCAVAFLSLGSGIIEAQDSLNVRMLAELHPFVEQCRDVRMSGSYAYLTSGMASGFRVLDLSEPTAPTEVGYSLNTDPCPGVSVWTAYKVAVSGNYAYVLYFDGYWSFTHFRLYVYDVSDPSAPRQMGHLPLPDHCMNLFVEGTRAYVTVLGLERFMGVKVIDVSDPMQPTEVGSFQTPGMAQEAYAVGSTVYVADGSALVVYDVSDPGSPVELGSYSPPGGTWLIHHVAVQGDYVYIADADFGIRILDASDLSQIREIGSFPHNQGDVVFFRIVAHDNRLYYLQDAVTASSIACPPGVAQGVRTSAEASALSRRMAPESAAPALDLETMMTPFSACSACPERGRRASLRSAHSGWSSERTLVVLDVSDPAAPVMAGSYEMGGDWCFYGFDCCDGYAAVAGAQDGLHILDVSVPASIAEVGLHAPYALTASLALRDCHAFVATYGEDLVVYDVSDPSSPTEVTSLHFPDGSLRQISTWENHLFVPGVEQNRHHGVTVLDISDPLQPTEIAHWSCAEGIPYSVERYGNLAFVCSGPAGVEVFDVTDVTQPVLLGTWTLWDITANPDFAVLNVRASWPYLFAPDMGSGLYVLDVSDPAGIVDVASCPTPGDATWVDISSDHNYVYVADHDGGLRIIDVSDPLTPVEVGFHQQNLVLASYVAARGDSVYVADAQGTGLHVFDVSDPDVPVEVAYHVTPGAVAHSAVPLDGLVYFLDFTHLEIFELTEESGAADDTPPSRVASGCRIVAIHPNPVSAEARVTFDIPEAGRVTLRIYNISGQEVYTLESRLLDAGRQSLSFDATPLPRGTYVLRLASNRQTHSRRLTVVN